MNKRTILVTGVSSGIGASLAEFYLAEGCTVLGVSRRTPENLCRHENFRFSAIDLTKHDQINSVFSTLFAGVEKLDVAILNAGMLGEIADMKDTNIAQLELLMDVNVWSNKTMIDWLMAATIETRQIVTVSSGAAVNGNRGWNGYSISKAALNMLTKLYAVENPGTHFTALAPGLVDTAMQDYLCGLNEDNRFESLEVLKSRRETELMPDPDQLAPRLAEVVDSLSNWSPSGDFVDIRRLPEEVAFQ